MPQIESLLSARLFLSPQVVGKRLYFISNLSGHLSLYVMDLGGSVPEPLLPPQIALQNPDLLDGYAFQVFPGLGKIMVVIDHDGDENYQPMLIPIEGGIPEPAFGERLAAYRVHLLEADAEANIVYLNAESRQEAMIEAYQGRLATGELTRMAASRWGAYVAGVSDDHRRVIIGDGYTTGDTVLYLWTDEAGERRLLYGTPIEERAAGETPPLTAFGRCSFTHGDGVLCISGLFSDTYGLAFIPLDDPEAIHSVAIEGGVHTGVGELDRLIPPAR